MSTVRGFLARSLPLLSLFFVFVFFSFFPVSRFLQSSFSIPSLFSYFLSFLLISSFCLPFMLSRFLFLFSYLPFLISFSVFFFTSSFPHPILLRPSPFQTSPIPLTFLSLGSFLPYSRLLFLLFSPFPSSSSVLFFLALFLLQTSPRLLSYFLLLPFNSSVYPSPLPSISTFPSNYPLLYPSSYLQFPYSSPLFLLSLPLIGLSLLLLFLSF